MNISSTAATRYETHVHTVLSKNGTQHAVSYRKESMAHGPDDAAHQAIREVLATLKNDEAESRGLESGSMVTVDVIDSANPDEVGWTIMICLDRGESTVH